jgi:hypothetical protein
MGVTIRENLVGPGTIFPSLSSHENTLWEAHAVRRGHATSLRPIISVSP